MTVNNWDGFAKPLNTYSNYYMIFVIIGVVLGLVLLLWIWKVPVKRSVNALKEDGSSAFEAYFLVFLMITGSAVIIYFLSRIM